jgi:protein-S-isoprenylcysteine O-methyltransferase Ste14
MLLVFLGPRTLPGLPPWRGARIWVVSGGVIGFTGVLLLMGCAVHLGANLTPLPRPKVHGTLVQTGPYALVRHPMYSAGLAIAFGWALLVQGWLTLLYAAALWVYLDLKSRREERWLLELYPDYAAYRRRVPRFVPFVH